MIRRDLITKIFNWREETILNFNYHPSLREGIRQIICPAVNAEIVTAGKKRRGYRNCQTHTTRLDYLLGIIASELGRRKRCNDTERM